MQLIHEVLAVLLKNGIKEKLLDRSNFDPLSLQHLINFETQAGVDDSLAITKPCQTSYVNGLADQHTETDTPNWLS